MAKSMEIYLNIKNADIVPTYTDGSDFRLDKGCSAKLYLVKKKNLDVYYFSFISWILKSQSTY